MGCPALCCSAAALLSGVVTGEPAAASAAPALGDPTFTGEFLQDRGSDRSPCFYGEGENEVRSEASLGAGGRDGWDGGKRSARSREAQLGLAGLGHPARAAADTSGGQKAEGATQEGRAGRVLLGPPALALGVCWCWEDVALTLSPRTFHLWHTKVRLPQHLPCGPDHCLSRGEAQRGAAPTRCLRARLWLCSRPGALARSTASGFCEVLVPRPGSACALATASAKLTLKTNKHP